MNLVVSIFVHRYVTFHKSKWIMQIIVFHFDWVQMNVLVWRGKSDMMPQVVNHVLQNVGPHISDPLCNGLLEGFDTPKPCLNEELINLFVNAIFERLIWANIYDLGDRGASRQNKLNFHVGGCKKSMHRSGHVGRVFIKKKELQPIAYASAWLPH